jgi:hypothetical protein
MVEPTRNTAPGDVSHTIPSAAGMTTAAIWLMVKLTLEVAAISCGSEIFWK